METGDKSFKKCPCCGYTWATREAFLSDGKLKINGYLADLKHIEEGLFLFTHLSRGCGSTMAVKAGDFKDLYDGPIYTERKTGSEECPGHCLHIYDLERCPAECECAYVREVLQTIEHWPRG
jgi:hypothetical protein